MKHTPPSRLAVGGLFIGLLSLLCVGFRPFLTSSDVGGYRLSHAQGQLLMDLAKGPDHKARAAILYDVDTGQVLYEHLAHDRLSPASTTKLATAIVTLRHLGLDQKVTVGQEVLGVEGTNGGLEPGDYVTVEKLMYALLLTSANDAAMALAAAAGGGSVDTFVGWMNDLAAELGLHDTHFVNPHGLDAEGHYSSAYDLMVLTGAALANPTIAGMVATPRKQIDDWSFVNTNELLGSYPGVDGVKTGTTGEAGQCLVASATKDGHRVILVVLGSADRYADARTVLDYYYTQYQWRALDMPATQLTALPRGEDGRARYLVLSTSVQSLLARWELPWVRWALVWDAPGAESGRARFTVDGRTLGEAPVSVRAP